MEKKSKVDEMTLEELRADLAERDGWSYGKCSAGRYWWTNADGKRSAMRDHPVPATLDAIAAAMPEGWVLTLEQRQGAWTAIGNRIGKLSNCDAVEGAHADTEILARARLAVACHRASAK